MIGVVLLSTDFPYHDFSKTISYTPRIGIRLLQRYLGQIAVKIMEIDENGFLKLSDGTPGADFKICQF